MDHAAFQSWLDRYIDAWRLLDPVAIGDLFSADVRYAYDPFEEAVVGRKAVVDSWLARCVHQPRRFGGWRRVATGSARFVLLRRTPRAHAGPRGCNTISQVRVPAAVGCSTR